MAGKTEYYNRAAALVEFRYFRKTWSPPASYHLTRIRLGVDWKDRLASAFWLMHNGIPRNGKAPSDGRS